MDTDHTRQKITCHSAPYTESETVILLLCDILEELRKNAENRKKALETWAPK